MPTISDIKSGFILVLILVIFLMYCFYKVSTDHYKNDINILKSQNLKLIDNIDEQNKKVDEMNTAAISKEKLLKAAELKAEHLMSSSKKRNKDLLTVDIPPGCEDAVQWAVNEALMMKEPA
jgi:hypothetical protein